MPELPEVETVVRGLRASILNRSIVGIRIGKSDFIDDPGALAEFLPGARIAAVERFGKFIAITIQPSSGTSSDRDVSAPSSEGKAFLIVHLGMTGQLIPRGAADAVAPHTHVFIELDDGRELRYTDIRRFGRIAFVPESLIAPFQSKLGADPLEITAAEFVATFQSRHARVKALLLDQSVLRGMGNIYADESLWRARIHPARIAANAKPNQLRQLHAAMQKVLAAAIRLRGSSISDFLDAEGEPGSYQLRHRVYGRKGKPCPRCGATIRRIVVSGRGSYFCPDCQPAPRARTSKRALISKHV
jgi:formamidopyrimidine-DNA glycosylase